MVSLKNTTTRFEKTSWFVLFFLWVGLAYAEEPAGKAKKEKGGKATQEQAKDPGKELIIQDRIQVIGSAEKASKTPGSAHYLSKATLAKQSYGDIHRILRQVPGINIQEEEGLGLRPNIGIRGTGVERSQKINLMEDGVLIAPAPYTAPAAYYFPTAARMDGIEVLKGSGAIKQGPYTNGGTLNLISSLIPQDQMILVNGSAGSHDTAKLRVKAGNSYERFGWLAETYQLDSNGFKDLDGGGDTGVDLEDYLIKLRFNSSQNARIYQRLDLKAGKTEQFGNETYLGLTAADFEQDPYRRYAASSGDFIDTDHEQLQLRYFVKFNPNFDITATVYQNDYFRNWHKAERVNGTSNATILNNPANYATELAILRGEINSDPEALTVRNNRRNYQSRGIQTAFHWDFLSGSAEHNLEVGMRHHKDEEDRFQNDEFFQMIDGALHLNRIGEPGSQTNRFSEAEATSIYVQDTIVSGNWSFRPGLRFENINYTRLDFSKTDPTRGQGPTRVRENGVEVLLPGMGVHYEIDDDRQVFGSINRGFSPPGAGRNDATEEEKSTNFEFGYRYSQPRIRTEVIGFFNDYDNLLGTETLSGGGGTTGDVFNGGEVEVKGLEATLNYEFSKTPSGLSFPLALTYTYTTSEFKTSFETSFADWAPSVARGDSLPYIPENQLSAAFGVRHDRWSFHLNGNYVDDMRTVAGQGAIPANEQADSRVVWDLSADITLWNQIKLYAQGRNLTGQDYIVARRPYGVRPGLRRTFLFGISARF